MKNTMYRAQPGEFSLIVPLGSVVQGITAKASAAGSGIYVNVSEPVSTKQVKLHFFGEDKDHPFSFVADRAAKYTVRRIGSAATNGLNLLVFQVIEEPHS